MSNGILRVQTYAARESAPVGDVRIHLRCAGSQPAQEMEFYTDGEGNETSLREGETMLVPATTDVLNVSGAIKFIETYV